MGVLDDAIREHLDLKRRRGASEDEIAEAEAEALGPARRSPYADDEGFGPGETLIIDPSSAPEPAPPPPPDAHTRVIHDIDEDPLAPPPPVHRSTVDEDTAEHPPPFEELSFEDEDDGEPGQVSE